MSRALAISKLVRRTLAVGLLAFGLGHATAWAAVEGFYLPGKESIEIRYMYDPSLPVAPKSWVQPLDPSRWDVWTSPDGETHYLEPQLRFGNSDIEGILIRPREYRNVGDIADYDIHVRLSVSAWERRFRAGVDKQYVKARPVMLISGRLIDLDPNSTWIGESVGFSLSRAGMSPFLNALTPAPQPIESGDRAEAYRQWLDGWSTTHPDDFLALSEWTNYTLLGKHGCDASLDVLDRYLKGVAAHPELEDWIRIDLYNFVMEIQRRLRIHGLESKERELIALLRSAPGLSDKVRDEAVKNASEDWERFENESRKNPGAVLIERFQHLVYQHDDCDGAQVVMDQLLQIKDAKAQEAAGSLYVLTGNCLAQAHRIADAESVLQRLKASDAKDKQNDIAVLEDAIARSKAAPAPASSGATP